MALDSMKEIFDRMEQEGKPFWEIVLETDMDERQVTRNQSMAKMLITWQAMADAADSYTGRRKSVSGLVGGDGMKMRQYCLRGEAMSGGYVSEVIAEALSMAESNACMCRIVAAPTAGACGVLPAVLLPLCRYEELSQHQLLEALYVASGIGAVIAYRACIAGASGGCQAEIGTASAMAAALGVDPLWLLGYDVPRRTGQRQSVPILGTIRAGLPMAAEQRREGWAHADVPDPEGYFYLRVTGDSMINAGIRDGDLVLLRRQDTAENGQIVACLVDGEDATLKRFRRQRDMVLLQPENPVYEPKLVPLSDFETGAARIVGVAVRLVREL